MFKSINKLAKTIVGKALVACPVTKEQRSFIADWKAATPTTVAVSGAAATFTMNPAQTGPVSAEVRNWLIRTFNVLFCAALLALLVLAFKPLLVSALLWLVVSLVSLLHLNIGLWLLAALYSWLLGMLYGFLVGMFIQAVSFTATHWK